MKCEFKQACEIEGKMFGPDMRKKPGTFNVPGYFVFVAYFIALFGDKKIKILEVSDEDIKEIEEASRSERFKDVEPNEEILSVLESLVTVKEESDEGKDEESSDVVTDGDSTSVGEQSEQSEASQPSTEVQGEQVQSEQEVKTEESVEASEVKKELLSEEEAKELAFLEEKKLRLTNKEKKRHQELLEKKQG